MDRVQETAVEGTVLRSPGTPDPRNDLTRARILLVDDEEPNLQLLRRLLASRGYRQVADTPDPLQVLALYQQFRPDLICLDLHMSPLERTSGGITHVKSHPGP